MAKRTMTEMKRRLMAQELLQRRAAQRQAGAPVPGAVPSAYRMDGANLRESSGSTVERETPGGGASGARTAARAAAPGMVDDIIARQQPGMTQRVDTAAPGNLPRAPVVPAPIITEKVIERANETLRRFKDGKALLESRIIEAQEWWKLHNWREINRQRGTKGAQAKKSSTAWLWASIVGKHADYMSAYPEPIFLPQAADDKEEAQRLRQIVPVVLKQNRFKRTYSKCGWQKLREGTGAYSVLWDKDALGGLGEISIRKVNMLNLFWEPGVDNIQDSSDVFLLAYVSNKRLEAEYPHLKGKLRGGKEMLLSEYMYEDHVDESDKSIVVDWYYHTYDGSRKVLQLCRYVGKELLYASEHDPVTRESGYYEDGKYPFVLDPLYEVEGSPAGFGYIFVGKDSQMDIDTMNQAIVLNSAMSATPRYFHRKDGGVNRRQFLDVSQPLVDVNGNLGADSLQPITVPSLPSNALNAYQGKIDELKFVTGNTDVHNGAVPSGVTSGVAIAALKEDAGRTSRDSNEATYDAMYDLYEMVLERIRQFYDMPRQFRIIGERGAERFETYTNDALKLQTTQGVDGKESYRLPVFDIDVRVQRENPYTQMATNDLAVQFYGMGIFNPQMADQALLMLDMMEFKGKDEIVQKIQQNAALMQMAQEALKIALALAQRYEPMLFRQVAMMAQKIGLPIPAAAMAGAPVGNAEQGQSAQDNGKRQVSAHTPQTDAMRQRVATATQPG